MESAWRNIPQPQGTEHGNLVLYAFIHSLSVKLNEVQCLQDVLRLKESYS